jgi:hypothetical protein
MGGVRSQRAFQLTAAAPREPGGQLPAEACQKPPGGCPPTLRTCARHGPLVSGIRHHAGRQGDACGQLWRPEGREDEGQRGCRLVGHPPDAARLLGPPGRLAGAGRRAPPAWYGMRPKTSTRLPSSHRREGARKQPPPPPCPPVPAAQAPAVAAAHHLHRAHAIMMGDRGAGDGGSRAEGAAPPRPPVLPRCRCCRSQSTRPRSPQLVVPPTPCWSTRACGSW